MPITTLNWTNQISYGPRGARYEILRENGLYSCRVYTTDFPAGTVLADNAGSLEDAMMAAQRHAEALASRYEDEGHVVTSALDGPRRR